MHEPEVQPLVSLIFRCLKIFKLLLCRHRIPYFVAGLIAPDIVGFGQTVETQIANRNAEQCPVTALVIWRIIYSV